MDHCDFYQYLLNNYFPIRINRREIPSLYFHLFLPSWIIISIEPFYSLYDNSFIYSNSFSLEELEMSE